MANEALEAIAPDLKALNAGLGRPSIPPERLLGAMLLQAFYSIRSERQLTERIEFDLLFRWFVGLGADEPVWNHSSFSKNRDRLLDDEIAARFLAAILARPRVRQLLSSEHFSVDGTLIEAWASMKSVRPRGSSGASAVLVRWPQRPCRFRGETRSKATHASITDPDARLYRKGPGMAAKLAFMGHALMENRSGLLVDACVTRADGHAERTSALPRCCGSSHLQTYVCTTATRLRPRRPLMPSRRSWRASTWRTPTEFGHWTPLAVGLRPKPVRFGRARSAPRSTADIALIASFWPKSARLRIA